MDSIAVITPDFSKGFAAEVLTGIQEEYVHTNLDMAIYCTAAANRLGREEYLIDKIINEKKCGVIIQIAGVMTKKSMKKCTDAGIEVVFIENQLEGGHSISTNNEKGAYEGTKHLIKTGKKKIGVVVGENLHDAQSQRQRLHGYSSALKEFGLEFNDRYIYNLVYYNYREGRDAFKYLKMNDVDSIFCIGGDYVAYGILDEAKKERIDIPGQIAIMGFDDIEISEEIRLTTIRQPILEMGRQGFKFAANILANPNIEKQHIEYDPKLIIRDTA